MSMEVYWTSHSVLLRETRISGYLVNIEPLRIGSGRESPLGAPIDLAVLRIQYGDYTVPYIPGSSLKGVFRSFATAVARSGGMSVCSGLSRETCIDRKEVSDPEFGSVTLGDIIEAKIRGNRSNDAMEMFWKEACLMCKIFGSPGYRGKIDFEDVYPIDENGELLPVRTGARTGIAINRRTGAVIGHALYTVEYVEPGAKFKFNIHSTNLPNYVLGLIGLILRMINEGQVKVGGFKSRGFGKMRVEKLRFMNRDVPASTAPVMRSLEKDVDTDVSLQELVRVENGWLVTDGEVSWKVLEKLEEAWNNVISKSRSH